jgi:predicted small secreted protein
MMRNVLLCCLFLLCAIGLVACDNPARAARREVDRVSRINQRMDLNLKRATRAALLDVAKAEGQRRGAELKLAGCTAAMAIQPSATLAEPCKSVVAASEARYSASTAAITTPAKKIDAAIGAVYASLLVVLDVLEDVDAGLKPGGWQAKLAQLVAEAVKLYTDAFAAFNAWKTAIGGVK